MLSLEYSLEEKPLDHLAMLEGVAEAESVLLVVVVHEIEEDGA